MRNFLLRLFKLSSILVFLLLFSQPCSAKTEDLKFSILLDKTEYKEQEPINVIFELECQGKEPAWVNKRFYANSTSVPRKQRGEVTLKATSPSGKELPCKFAYEAGFPKSDYFELLEPGKKAVSEYPRNLRGYFDFTEPGVYKVEAVYENIFGPEIGLDMPKGKIYSKTVSFKVIKE